MSRDFDAAAHLVRTSLIFTTLRRAANAAERQVEQSRIVAAVRSSVREFSGLTAALRLRLAGVLLLIAAVTNAVLLLVVSRQMAPAPPFAMPLLAGVAAMILIARSFR